MKFEELGINEEILRAIDFDTPTDIQEKAIPVIMQGKDVIAGSATGSGKTLVFASGAIQKAVRGKGIQTLVLVPTRELAQQVADGFKKFSRFKPLNVSAIFGGVSLNPQFHELGTADIVVGTPGRILDHMERQTINLTHVNTLILDEADRMLDMGFMDDVRKIISQCPRHRQTMLFSATIMPQIEHLAQRYMNDPVKISVDSYVDPKLLKQIYYDVDEKSKFSLLVHLLKHEESGLSMVFCNTQRSTDFVAKNLYKQGIDAIAIHGGFSQAKRTQTMNQFHRKKFSVLVCTDVAARGLDIGSVSHVYNYDLPKDSKNYVHRIGRTARAGNEGKAINLLSDRDHQNFTGVLRDNDVQIDREEKPEFERIKFEHHTPQRHAHTYNDRRSFRKKSFR